MTNADKRREDRWPLAIVAAGAWMTTASLVAMLFSANVAAVVGIAALTIGALFVVDRQDR